MRSRRPSLLVPVSRFQAFPSWLLTFSLLAAVVGTAPAAAQGSRVPAKTRNPKINTPVFLDCLSREQQRLLESYLSVRNVRRFTPQRTTFEPLKLTASQWSTFCSITHALEHTQLMDKDGNSLGQAIELVVSVEEVLGEDARLPGDRQFRLFVRLREDSLAVLDRAVEFRRGRNGMYHPSYPVSYRQVRKRGTPAREAGLQLSTSLDGLRGDIDVDYAFGLLHLLPYGSDVRAAKNYERHRQRWPVSPVWLTLLRR